MTLHQPLRRASPANRKDAVQTLLGAVVCAALAAPTAAQRLFDDLYKHGLPDAADATTALAVGDLNGDGRLDVVCGNFGQDRLLFGDGNGTFVEVTSAGMPVDNDPTTSLALGDLDGDGDLDLVIGVAGAQNRVYLNNGAGLFTDATLQCLPVDTDDTRSVALGDLDGDGDLDLVLGNYGQGRVGEQNRVYLNNGQGQFTDATSTSLPASNSRTACVALGDLDGDGDLDLVAGNWGLLYGTTGEVYRNNGNGTFATSSPWCLGKSVSAMALGDFDGDGDLDLLAGFGRDLYGPLPAALYLNNGNGAMLPAASSALPTIREVLPSIAVGDVDGDGDLDALCGNGEAITRSSTWLLRNDGHGVFTDATPQAMPFDRDGTTALALGDVDGDGDLDLLAGNANGVTGGQNRLFLNDGTGAFADLSARFLPLSQPLAVAALLGDVDGDGDADLVLAEQYTGPFRRNRLCLNDGAGTFTDVSAARMPNTGVTYWSLDGGDLDSDGDLDLVFGAHRARTGLLLNNGNGTFMDYSFLRMPALTDDNECVVLGDVDGDGDLDLFVGNIGQDRLFLNSGNAFFSDATATHLPVDNEHTRAAAFGDLDGDGDLDLVVGSYRRALRLYRNDGSGHFADVTPAQLPGPQLDCYGLALGDIDGDGDLDLVAGNFGFTTAGNRQNRLFRNDGTGRFTDVTATQLPAVDDYTRPVLLRDVDDDGDLDICFGNIDRSRVCINDGTGSFHDAPPGDLPADLTQVAAIAAADVDGDGDLDLAFATYWRNRLCFNLHRQLDTPRLLRPGRPASVDVHVRNLPAGTTELALPFLSTTRLSLPLPPYGTLGIDPMVALPLCVFAAPGGTATLPLAVPNNPGLVGIPIHTQAVFVSQPFTVRLGNVTADAIQR